MTHKKIVDIFNLQLFADEVSTPTGDNNAAPPVAETGDNSSTADPPVSDDATGADASGTEIQDEQNAPARLSFEELIKNEDTAKEAKAFVNQKFGERFNEEIKSLKDENAKMREILGFQNIRYGLDPDSDTYLDELNTKVQNDAKLFEDEAFAAGMDADSFMKVKQAERIMEQNRRATAEREHEELINNHIMNLRAQEAELKNKYPDFDLETELQNRHFKSLVDPPALGGSGLPVENAYYALHYKEINKSIASQAADKATIAVANSVAANKARPSENVNTKTAPTVPTKNYDNMTKEDFDAAREKYRRTGIRPF